MRSALVAVIALAAITCSACGGASDAEPAPLKRGVPALTVSLKDGARFEGLQAITVQLSESVSYASIVFSGMQGREYVTGVLHVEPSALLSSVQTVPLLREPVKAGIGSFERGLSPETSEKATSGSLSLTRDAAGMHGTISTPVDRLSGEFAGTFLVSCAVWPESLGRPSPGGGILVLDSGFESAFCKPFAVLRK